MKVRLKVQKEINGEMAQPGWVYGVDEPTGNAWIAAGEADQVADEVRTFRYPANAPLMLVCVDPSVPGDAAQEKTVPKPAALSREK